MYITWSTALNTWVGSLSTWNARLAPSRYLLIPQITKSFDSFTLLQFSISGFSVCRTTLSTFVRFSISISKMLFFVSENIDFEFRGGVKLELVWLDNKWFNWLEEGIKVQKKSINFNFRKIWNIAHSNIIFCFSILSFCS